MVHDAALAAVENDPASQASQARSDEAVPLVAVYLQRAVK